MKSWYGKQEGILYDILWGQAMKANKSEENLQQQQKRRKIFCIEIIAR